MSIRFEARKVPTNNFCIDSLNIYIPVSRCKFVSDEFYDTTTTVECVTGTGQEVRSIKNANPLFIIPIAEGVSLKYRRYKKRLIGKYKEREDCLELRVTAKHLTTEYFDGITSNNTERLFNFIIRTKLIDITYQDFLKYAEVLDVDICRNHYITDSDNYLAGLREVKKYSDRITNKKSRLRKDDDTQHYALYFGKRELKIYWKCGELMVKSSKFYHTYLKNYDITNLFRVEFNIPNTNEFKRLFGKAMTLTNVLNLSQSDMMQSYADVSKKYLAPPVNKKVVAKHDAWVIGILELLKSSNDGKVEQSDIDYYFKMNPSYQTDSMEHKEQRRVRKLRYEHRKKLVACWNDGYRDMSWKQHKTDQMELFNLLGVFVR